MSRSASATCSSSENVRSSGPYDDNRRLRSRHGLAPAHQGTGRGGWRWKQPGSRRRAVRAVKFELQRKVLSAYLDLALAEERVRIQRDDLNLPPTPDEFGRQSRADRRATTGFAEGHDGVADGASQSVQSGSRRQLPRGPCSMGCSAANPGHDRRTSARPCPRRARSSLMMLR